MYFLFFHRFQLTDPSIPVMEKAAQDPERKVTFVDLVSKSLNFFSVVAHCQNELDWFSHFRGFQNGIMFVSKVRSLT